MVDFQGHMQVQSEVEVTQEMIKMYEKVCKSIQK